MNKQYYSKKKPEYKKIKDITPMERVNFIGKVTEISKVI